MSTLAELFSNGSYSQRVTAEVRAHTARRGLMYKDLARALGMHPSQITKRMRGQVPFTLDELAELAGLFGIEPAELMPKCAARDSNPEPADSESADFIAPVIPLHTRRTRRTADRRRPAFTPFPLVVGASS